MANLDEILSGQGVVASASPETVTTEAATATEVTQENLQTGAEGEQGQKMVPHEALHAEKQKVKRYTEQVAEFEKKMTEREAAWERRFEQLIGAVKPQQPTEAEKPKKDIWDDPDEFVQSGIQAALTPFQKEMQATLNGIAKDAAIARHGDAVDAAERAFMLAVQSRTVDQADFDKVLKAPNRYSAAVEWHKRAQAQAEIGDPVAFKEKLRAEILAELQGGTQQQTQTGQAAVTMPTDLAGTRNVGNRSGPAWSGPQSINDIFDRARKPKTA